MHLKFYDATEMTQDREVWRMKSVEELLTRVVLQRIQPVVAYRRVRDKSTVKWLLDSYLQLKNFQPKLQKKLSASL